MVFTISFELVLLNINKSRMMIKKKNGTIEFLFNAHQLLLILNSVKWMS